MMKFFQQGILLPLLTPFFEENHNLLLGLLMALAAVSSYLIGSLNFAIIISKKQYKDDIRAYGSKNAGATNMMRTYGGKAAALTFLGDALKAVVSALIGYACAAYLGAYVAGLFCVIGHMFPIYYRFRGGKGVVTAAMSILMCNPLVFLFVLLIFLIVAIGTRFVSLASVMSALFYPLILSRIDPWLTGAEGTPYTVFAIIIMVLIVFKHRENIVRLWNHEESKFTFKKTIRTAADEAKEHTVTEEAPKKATQSTAKNKGKKK